MAASERPAGPADVFISYSSKDIAWAKKLERVLENQGLNVWRDKSRLEAGERVPNVVSAVLREAKAVVTIWSDDAVISDWVRHETSYAEIANKLATVSIPGFDYGTLPGLYRDLHCDDLLSALNDPTKLLGRLKNLADPARFRNVHIDINRLPLTFATELFGREKDIQDLEAAWNGTGTEKTNIAILEALGGAGKTSLVNNFVNKLAARSWGGAEAVYVWSFRTDSADDSRQTSAGEFFSEALAFFGHLGPIPKSESEKGTRLAELINSRRSVLILDGLEPLQHGPARQSGGIGDAGLTGALKDLGLRALLRQLARDNRGIVILTTRLRLSDLRDVPSPMVLRKNVASIPTPEGVKLVRALGVNGADAELERIVTTLRGHAIALTLVANWLRDFRDGDARCISELPTLVDIADENERDPFRVMNAYEMMFKQQIAEQRSRGQSSVSAAGKQLALLFVTALFERPVTRSDLMALTNPPIPGLTDTLAELNKNELDYAINSLRNLHLLLPRETSGDDAFDAHPLVRAYFRKRLHKDNPGLWKKAHTRLFNHYKTLPIEEQPSQEEDLRPLLISIAHGCAAGLHQEAYDTVWFPRISRGFQAYLSQLGAFGATLNALGHFFTSPWDELIDTLEPITQINILLQVLNSLSALGRLDEAIRLSPAAIKKATASKNWPAATMFAVMLSKMQLAKGSVQDAVDSGDDALSFALKSKNPEDLSAAYATLATAKHEAGEFKIAGRLFKNAELEYAKSDPQRPYLHSYDGYLYCDFLLEQGLYGQVAARTRVMQKWHESAGSALGLDMALIRLLQARTLHAAWRALAGEGTEVFNFANSRLAAYELAELCKQLSIIPDDLRAAPRPVWPEIAKTPEFCQRLEYIFNEAVQRLSKAGRQDDLPRGLLARAAFAVDCGKFNSAMSDLEEVKQIACRENMLLFLADYYLECARAALAQRLRSINDHNDELTRQIEAACGSVREIVERTGSKRQSRALQALQIGGEKSVLDPDDEARKATPRIPQTRFCVNVPAREHDIQRYYDLLCSFPNFEPKDVPTLEFFQCVQSVNPYSLILVGDGHDVIFGGIELYGFKKGFFNSYLNGKVTDHDFKRKHATSIQQTRKERRLYCAITVNENRIFSGAITHLDHHGNRVVRDLLLGVTARVLKTVYFDGNSSDDYLDIYALQASMGGEIISKSLGFAEDLDWPKRRDGLPLLKLRLTAQILEQTITNIMHDTPADWAMLDLAINPNGEAKRRAQGANLLSRALSGLMPKHWRWG